MTSNHQDMIFSSVIVFPSTYLLTFINHHYKVWWLPQPKIYSLQVKAEVCFQMERFMEESIRASERIDSIFPATRRVHNSIFEIPVFEEAIATTMVYHSNLEERIAEYSFWRQWMWKSEDVMKLQESLALVPLCNLWILLSLPTMMLMHPALVKTSTRSVSHYIGQSSIRLLSEVERPRYGQLLDIAVAQPAQAAHAAQMHPS